MLMKKVASAAKIAASLGERRQRQFWMQRAVTSIPSRMRRAAATAAGLPHVPTPSAEIARAADELRRQSYSMLPGLIPPEWVADMKAYFSGQPCGDPYRPETGTFVGPENAPKGTHVAFFSNEIASRAPHALDIANMPRIVDAVAADLGARPTISYMTAWWSVPAHEGAKQAENWHRDVDDYDFTKFFLYLTDVDDDAGPHMLLKGSHLVDKLTPIRRYTDEEVYAAFGKENEIKFTGPAGSCFLEKTYGMHRGFPPKSKPRLIFQVLYSLRETIYGPKQPIVDAKGLGIDPFMNRIYCRT